jgi:hypothetical protein
MKCYYHKENPAVGICQACYRGICQDCVAIQESSICCNNIICKERTNNLFTVINTNINAAKSRKVRSSYIFEIIMGILFIIIGYLFFSPGDNSFAIVFIIMGLTYFLYGIFPFMTLLYQKRKISKK